MSKEENAADHFPRSGSANFEEDRFFGKIGVPDEHVLRKSDIGPKYGEGEHPFSHVMVVLDGDRVGQDSIGAQAEEGEGKDREEGPHTARHTVDPEDGGVPMGLEGHDPIDAGQGSRQEEEEHARSGEPFALEREIEILTRNFSSSECCHITQKMFSQKLKRVDDNTDHKTKNRRFAFNSSIFFKYPSKV